jgi:hypothetical protein
MTETVILTAEQLSLRWGVPATTLGRWRWSGHGPIYVKMGKHISYRLSDVETFEEEHRRKNTCDRLNQKYFDEQKTEKGGRCD